MKRERLAYPAAVVLALALGWVALSVLGRWATEKLIEIKGM